MKKLTLKWMALLAVCSAFTLTGCNRNNNDAAPDNFTSAEDNAVAESEMASVYELVDIEARFEPTIGGRQGGSGNLPACATRTYNQTTKTLTLDFGTTNCLCKDGMYRRGQITAVFNGKYRTPGATITITLNNYFVNDNQHTGTKLITNLGNGSGNFKYSVQVQNASVTTPNGTISWSADRVVERVAGDSSINLLDDVYLVTGSANGTNRKGVNFTVVIDQPLKKVFQAGCARNFVAGKLTITNTGNSKSMHLNYDPIGGEPCDKIAEVTVNGKTKQITLR
jgi:hypothetical protein